MQNDTQASGDEYFSDPREARWRAQQEARDPAPALQAKRIRGFWEQVFALDRANREGTVDMHPHTCRARLRIAWRITRFLAIVQGRIQLEQRLSELAESSGANDDGDMERLADLPKSLTPTARIYAPKKMVEALDQYAVPLVPPRPNGFISVEENLMREQSYLLFYDAISKLRGYFGNPVAAKDPFIDSDKWYGILDRNRCFQLYPDISEIVLYEERLVDRSLKYQVQHGQIKCHAYLRYSLMLSDPEARSVASMARKSARQQMEMDQEDERSVMTLRLQDFQERAKRAFNLREELQGMKQEALVRGLTKTQPETFMDVFARVVHQTAQEQPGQPGQPIRQIDIAARPRLPQTTEEDDDGNNDE